MNTTKDLHEVVEAANLLIKAVLKFYLAVPTLVTPDEKAAEDVLVEAIHDFSKIRQKFNI